MIGPSDINFVLSGGAINTDPKESLGGEPSTTPLTVQLFPDITATQSANGYTDFRCIYIVNDSGTNTLYAASVYIDNETANGVPVSLGFQFQNDIQQVSVAHGTSVTGGYMILQYEGTNFTVNWASNVNTWASNFQTAIAAITNLANVQVTGGVNGTTVIFQVNFIGDAGNRFHAILNVIDDSHLTSIAPGNVSVLKIFNGSPINSIAPQIDAPTTTPNGILFSIPTPASPLLLGDLRATDIVPVWVMRSCPANFAPLADDGFALKLSGNPFPGG